MRSGRLRASLLTGGLVAVLLGLALASGWQPGGPRDEPWDGVLPLRGAPGEAADFFLAQRVGAGEALPVARYEQALGQRARMPQAGGVRAKLGAPVWRAAGPDGVGGRTRALLIDPEDPDTLYAAGVSGGVWKSTDGAASWQAPGLVTLANLAVASLAMDPADRNTLFAGTGEGVYVGRPVTRSRGVRGNGIYVSRDGAASWRRLAATAGDDFDFVNRLVFDDAGRLHAATRTGLWVSADRGESWSRGLQPPNAEGCSELVHVPQHQRMVASCGVFSQSALYVSDDGGAGWRPVALPDGAGRTTLAVAPSDPSVLYALSAHRGDYAFLALHRSDDGGGSWQRVIDRADADPLSALVLSNPYASTDAACNLLPGPGLGQGWFDNVIAVDPVDPQVVFVGGVDLFRSDDGGRRFRLLSRWWADPQRPDYVHADQHAIVFDPRYDGIGNRRMYVANDGGIHRTDDARGPASDALCGSDDTPAWSAHNGGYLVTQFYAGAVSGDGRLLIGGTQDNGTHLGSVDATRWREVFGGDGGYAAIDPRDPRRYYMSTPYAFIVRTDDDGASFVSLRNGLPPQIANYLFIATFLLDPNDPDRLWIGAGPRLYRSDDRGTSWQPVGSGPIPGVTGVPSALAAAAGHPGQLAIGFDSGHIARSSDGGASWTVARPRDGFVSSLVIDPAEPALAYATIATFGGAHLLVSDDGGRSWTARDGSGEFALPDVPAHTLLIDPRDRARLWLGTDIGLFVSPDRGARWYADASGLGSVLIETLVLAGAGDEAELVAFTYGRGVHRARLSALPSPAFNPGYAGAWYEPATSGQGMLFETIPATGELAVGWYTYGAQDGAGANHRWLVGSGPLRDDSARIVLHRVAAGRFGIGADAVEQPVGELVVSFDGCHAATARYTLQLDGVPVQGEIPLARLTSARACQQFRASGDAALGLLARPAAAGAFGYGHGGSWNQPSIPRQGFLFEFDPDAGIVAASWYTYDPLTPHQGAEAPTWYTALGSFDGAFAELDVHRSTGGRFDQPAPVATTAIGTLRLSARSCTAIDAHYDIALADGSRRQGELALERIAPPTVCAAMAR